MLRGKLGYAGLSVPLPLSVWRSIQSLWLLNESKMSKSLINLQRLNELGLTCGKGLAFKGPKSFTCHDFWFTISIDTNRLCEPVYSHKCILYRVYRYNRRLHKEYIENVSRCSGTLFVHDWKCIQVYSNITRRTFTKSLNIRVASMIVCILLQCFESKFLLLWKISIEIHVFQCDCPCEIEEFHCFKTLTEFVS